MITVYSLLSKEIDSSSLLIQYVGFFPSHLFTEVYSLTTILIKASIYPILLNVPKDVLNICSLIKI